METYTLPTLVDQSLSQLPRWRRRWIERRMQSRRFNEQAFYDELAVKLCSCEDVELAVEMQGVFSAQDPMQAQFSFDPEKLKRVLDVITEFIVNDLPKIIEVIMTIIPLFTRTSAAPLLFTRTSAAPLLLIAFLAAAAGPCDQAYAANYLTPPPAVSLDDLDTLDAVTPALTLPLGESARMPERAPAVAENPFETDLSPVAAASPLDVGPVPAGDFVSAPIVQQDCPGGICPLPVQPVPVRLETRSLPKVTNTYERQWYNHDGLSLREHAEQMHGHSTAGLTDSQVAALNDHDHNTWGHGGHPASSSTSRLPSGTWAATSVATAPVRSTARYFINRRPVRTVGRSAVGVAARAVGALRPRAIIQRIRSRVADRRARRVARRGW